MNNKLVLYRDGIKVVRTTISDEDVESLCEWLSSLGPVDNKSLPNLSNVDIEKIRLRYEGRELAKCIASDFNITKQWINKLAKVEGWKRKSKQLMSEVL